MQANIIQVQSHFSFHFSNCRRMAGFFFIPVDNYSALFMRCLSAFGER